MGYWDDGIESLLGKTVISIEGDDDVLDFYTSDNKHYRMFHNQDCCESVYIDDICGNLTDLIGSPIIMAEEESNSEDDPGDRYADSYTWTFYKLATINGTVTIRWYGSSNGYYSERVDFIEV